MSQRFVVTPAAGGAGDAGSRPGGGGSRSSSPCGGPDPDPAASPEPPGMDALPILHYSREPNRYGRCGQSPRGAASSASGRGAGSGVGWVPGGGRWSGGRAAQALALGSARGVELVSTWC